MHIQFNAFIHKQLGKPLRTLCSNYSFPLKNEEEFYNQLDNVLEGNDAWLPEPFSSSTFCKTDDRDLKEHNLFSGEAGTSRLFVYNKDNPFDLNKLGKFEQFYKGKRIFEKRCSESHRVTVFFNCQPLSTIEQQNQVLIAPEIFGCGPSDPFIPNPMYGYVHVYPPKKSDPYESGTPLIDEVEDIDENHSRITVKAQAGYPYAEPFSPNIDFNLEINFYRMGSNYYMVEVNGTHNKFPFYELLIDGALIYDFKPDKKDDGPGLKNLNTIHSFSEVLQIQRQPLTEVNVKAKNKKKNSSIKEIQH